MSVRLFFAALSLRRPFPGVSRPGLMALAVLLAAGSLSAEPPAPRNGSRIRASNRHYRPGDWTTQSVTRFVRDLDIGPEEVYFATTGGITRFNHYSRRWQPPYTLSDGLANADVRLVAFDHSSGMLWCVTAEGLSCLEPASRLWRNFFYDEMGFQAGEVVQSIGFAADRRVVAVSDRSRWFEAPQSGGTLIPTAAAGPAAEIDWHGRRRPEETPPPYFFMADGLMYDQEKRTISDVHLRRFQITCWARDPWNTLWLGTWGLGAGRGDLNTSRLEMLSHGLWSPAVMTLAADEEALWAGGVQQERDLPAGITRWFDDSTAPEYLEPRFIGGFHEEGLTAIAGNDRVVWFGTDNGLVRYSVRRNSYRRFSQADRLGDDRITDLALDDRRLWVATEAGLSLVEDLSSGKKDSLALRVVDFKNLGSLRVYDVDLSDGRVWLATEYGLFFYEPETGRSERYSGAMGPGTQQTLAVACYGEEVWYATEDGVSALLQDEAAMDDWPLASLRQEPFRGRIHRLAVDGRSVWTAGDGGVMRLDRAAGRWIHYGVEDGLPSEQVFCLLLEGDYAWFGSAAGLTRFYWNTPYRID